jgi:hypothetical protein
MTDKKVVIQGGGTESEEYMACSAKVMQSSDKWWRLYQASQIFTNIQSAINSVS